MSAPPVHRIVVISDGYVRDDVRLFEMKVDHIVRAALDNDAVFRRHRDAFRVTTRFRPSPAGGDLGIVYNGSSAQGYFTERPGTAATVRAALRGQPCDTVVVLANVAGYGASTNGDIIYITPTQTWSAMAHEIGHRLGLADERGDDGATTACRMGRRVDYEFCPRCAAFLDRVLAA